MILIVMLACHGFGFALSLNPNRNVTHSNHLLQTANFSPGITGWTVSGNAGVQLFTATQFPSGVPHGSQAGLIAFNVGSIYQDVAATYQAGTRYTLNLFAGIRLVDILAAVNGR